MTATTDNQQQQLAGKRVRLDYTSDDWTNLKPGAEGTIALVDDSGTVHVGWDNGSNLGLVPGEDRWTVLPDRVTLRDYRDATGQALIGMMRRNLTDALYTEYYEEATGTDADINEITERYALGYCPALQPQPGDLTAKEENA